MRNKLKKDILNNWQSLDDILNNFTLFQRMQSTSSVLVSAVHQASENPRDWQHPYIHGTI